MRKQILIFAILFVSFFAFTFWLAQPPFRLNRKLLAKLPYAPYTLLVTDLDEDGHPEVTALQMGEPPIWVRFPFDKTLRFRFENCRGIEIWRGYYRSVLKALPVLTADKCLMLLRWKDEKAKLDPLPSLPNVPVEDAFVSEGESTGIIFLRVYRGKDVWLFTLTPKGEWKFASQFTSRFRKFSTWGIDDLADLDRDGLLDTLCVGLPTHSPLLGSSLPLSARAQVAEARVFWGERKKGETNLGGWRDSGFPQIADLDRDGWKEIVMVAKDSRLKIWRFDQRQKRLKVITTSPLLPVIWVSYHLHLFDLDGDGRKEAIVHYAGYCWVFQLRDDKLKMWQSHTGFWGWGFKQVKFGDQLALCGFLHRSVFMPRIWLEGGKLRWQFCDDADFTIFALLPQGKRALSPSNWRFQEAPFQLMFAGDIDGDGSDELVGYDSRWRRWRLYRAEVTKAGELRWRDVLLGREKPEPTAFALLVDGKRRGLVVAWEDGRLELLTIEGRR